MPSLGRPKDIFFICLALGWFADFLFWNKPWGLSLPLFTLLLVLTGFWFARTKKLAPSGRSLWLLIPITLFALVSLFRVEGFTVLLSRALVLLSLCVLAVTFLGGRWLDYGFADFVARLAVLFPGGLVLFAARSDPGRRKRKNTALRSLLPILRGLLLALPLLWFLSLLLSSADPFFSNWLNEWLGFLRIENLGEYIFRASYILILACVFSAVYLYALSKSREEDLLGGGTPWIRPLLGFGEAATMLACVNLLFVAFVVVQFRYFFGGAANIATGPTGLTYAEYARRGFAELVFVAVTSLLFFVILSSVTRRSSGQQKWFSALGILLFSLVSVILFSAYQRLLLYEGAYGFTRIRTYSHTFMIWLGGLLLAVVVLEALQRRRAFAVATLFAAFGFGASLSLLNVDGFIAQANIHRAQLGNEFDVPYVASLSEDAVHALAAEFHRVARVGDSDLVDQIAAALVCNATFHDYSADLPWQSWNWSRTLATRTWLQLNDDPEFPTYATGRDPDTNLLFASINGQSVPCETFSSQD